MALFRADFHVRQQVGKGRQSKQANKQASKFSALKIGTIARPRLRTQNDANTKNALKTVFKENQTNTDATRRAKHGASDTKERT